MLPCALGALRNAASRHSTPQALCRAFASDAVSVQSSSNPFLRFSSPVPKAIDHTPLLSTLPETKVCSLLC